MSIRVVLADDQALVRGGLRALIEAEPGIAVAGEAMDGAEAVAVVRAQRPDGSCEPLWLVLRLVEQLALQRAGETHGLYARIDAEALDAGSVTEMTGEQRSERLRVSIVLVGVLEGFAEIVAAEQAGGVEQPNSLDDLVLMAAK